MITAGSYQTPYQQPYQQPLQTPYQQPLQTPYQQPLQTPYQQPYQQPFQQPYQQPYQNQYQVNSIPTQQALYGNIAVPWNDRPYENIQAVFAQTNKELINPKAQFQLMQQGTQINQGRGVGVGGGRGGVGVGMGSVGVGVSDGRGMVGGIESGRGATTRGGIGSGGGRGNVVGGVASSRTQDKGDQPLTNVMTRLLVADPYKPVSPGPVAPSVLPLDSRTGEPSDKPLSASTNLMYAQQTVVVPEKQIFNSELLPKPVIIPGVEAQAPGRIPIVPGTKPVKQTELSTKTNLDPTTNLVSETNLNPQTPMEYISSSGPSSAQPKQMLPPPGPAAPYTGFNINAYQQQQATAQQPSTYQQQPTSQQPLPPAPPPIAYGTGPAQAIVAPSSTQYSVYVPPLASKQPPPATQVAYSQQPISSLPAPPPPPSPPKFTYTQAPVPTQSTLPPLPPLQITQQPTPSYTQQPTPPYTQQPTPPYTQQPPQRQPVAQQYAQVAGSQQQYQTQQSQTQYGQQLQTPYQTSYQTQQPQQYQTQPQQYQTQQPPLSPSQQQYQTQAPAVAYGGLPYSSPLPPSLSYQPNFPVPTSLSGNRSAAHMPVPISSLPPVPPGLPIFKTRQDPIPPPYPINIVNPSTLNYAGSVTSPGTLVSSPTDFLTKQQAVIAPSNDAIRQILLSIDPKKLTAHAKKGDYTGPQVDAFIKQLNITGSYTNKPAKIAQIKALMQANGLPTE